MPLDATHQLADDWCLCDVVDLHLPMRPRNGSHPPLQRAHGQMSGMVCEIPGHGVGYGWNTPSLSLEMPQI